MVLPVVIIFVCVAAALLQLGALRSPDITETRATRNGRKLTIAGIVVAVVYMSYTLLEYGTVSTPHALAMALVAMGQLAFGINSLLPHLWPDTSPGTRDDAHA
jgi:hypothetical protein